MIVRVRVRVRVRPRGVLGGGQCEPSYLSIFFVVLGGVSDVLGGEIGACALGRRWVVIWVRPNGVRYRCE